MSYRKRKTKLIRDSGPYRVDSRALSHGSLIVYPRWSQYGNNWQEMQDKGYGGGPGMMSRMALADDLESWLNNTFDHELVETWLEISFNKEINGYD